MVYGLIFLAVVVEGPLVTMAVGLLLTQKFLNPFIAYTIILTAELLSDTLYYSLGRWGKKKVAARFLKQGKQSPERPDRLKKIFAKHPGKTLFIGKMTHLAGVPTLISAGMAQVPFWLFMFFETLATVPKSFILLLVGFYIGQSITTINTYATYGTFFVTGSIILLSILYFVLRSRFEEKISQE